MIPFSPFRLDGVFYFRFFPFNLRLAILSVTLKEASFVENLIEGPEGPEGPEGTEQAEGEMSNG